MTNFILNNDIPNFFDNQQVNLQRFSTQIVLRLKIKLIPVE